MEDKIKFWLIFSGFILALIVFFYGLVIFSREIKNDSLSEYNSTNDTIITGYNMTNEGYDCNVNYLNKDGYIIVKKDTLKNK